MKNNPLWPVTDAHLHSIDESQYYQEPTLSQLMQTTDGLSKKRLSALDNVLIVGNRKGSISSQMYQNNLTEGSESLGTFKKINDKT